MSPVDLAKDREIAAGAMGNATDPTKDELTEAIRRARDDVANRERSLDEAALRLRGLLRLHLADHGPDVALGDQVLTIRSRGGSPYLYPKKPGSK